MKLYKNYKPIVSIILPTYNRSEFLKRAIDSVIIQTFSKWELIVVDDGSEDDTFLIINKLIASNKKIRYMKHSKRKLPLSLNAGIKASAGEYITFLGSDDEYLPEHLSLRVNELQNNDKIDLVYGGVKIIGDLYVKDKNDLSKKTHLSDCVIGGTFFGKRNMFIELGGFKNIEYSEDSEFYERAKSIYNIKKVKYPTYVYYRNTPDSICNKI